MRRNPTLAPFKGFPDGTRSKERACQCRRRRKWGFDPWVRKIPCRKKWQPTPVFLPGESHGQRSLVGYKSQTRLKRLSTQGCTAPFSLPVPPKGVKNDRGALVKVTVQRHRLPERQRPDPGTTEHVPSPIPDRHATQGQTKAWSPLPSSSRACSCTREAHRARGPTKVPLTSKRGGKC